MSGDFHFADEVLICGQIVGVDAATGCQIVQIDRQTRILAAHLRLVRIDDVALTDEQHMALVGVKA